MFKWIYILIFLLCAAARAETLDHQKLMLQSLEAQFPGAQIELKISPEVTQELQGISSSVVSFLNDNGRGEAHFLVGQKSIKVPFTAMINAYVAVKKISPKEKLHHIYFAEKRINIATGNERQYRGLFFNDKKEINRLETIRTILPGNYLLSTSIQRIPDVRRGDAIQVKLLGSGLTLTTSAIAQESATTGDQLRVLTQGNKKELKGKLVSKSLVEVKL